MDAGHDLVFSVAMSFLKELPRNTRNCIIVEPLWTLFGGVIFYFAPLYMKALGIAEIEMGLLNSLGLLFGFLFFLLAGPLTNKFGRHRTSLVWDLFSWSVSMLIWAFAQDFWWALVAVFFASGSKITMVSWNLLVSEDAREDQRVKVFAIVNILASLGGIVSLAAGLLLDTYGIIPTMRFTYIAGFISMTTMFITRSFFTTETENGRRVMAASKNVPLLHMLGEQLRSLAHAARDGHFALLTILYLIVTAVSSFAFFQIIYLKDVLAYTNTEVAIVPAVNTALTIILLTVVMPRMPKNSERFGVLIGFVLCGLGATGFLFLGTGMLWAVLIVQGLVAAALILVGAYRDSVFMNTVEESKRAELFGLVNMLTMLLSIPSGWFAGWLYSVHFLAPFIALLILFMAGITVTLLLLGHHHRTEDGAPRLLD